VGLTFLLFGPVSSAREDFGIQWLPLLVAVAGLVSTWYKYLRSDRRTPLYGILGITLMCLVMITISLWPIFR
jgi:hypothetical protein